ncbi:MarR family winged helix-turn-helix transcriptional regulator [Rhizobium paknamense]|uniref:MarR family transcriptional regulator for hemolysin n=1 Tax=Rhizobium paknamense TaxID=1206817 RepID=A0ABU0ID78_9HYPH|nr:MarR family transcriptional regulator [Rhizobium paknamense]MDQ0456197.1 MarR family transcriptional regulator for hemolysin [Rhizobium paknamense]
MNLDDDSTGDATPHFGFRLVSVARLWRRFVEEHLLALGFTDARWRPLVHLYHLGDGVTQKELAEMVGLDGSSLVRLLDILEGQTLIERRPDEGDRRVNRIFLTPSGLAVVKDIHARVLPVEEALLSGCKPDDLQIALKVFEQIQGRLKEGVDLPSSAK